MVCRLEKGGLEISQNVFDHIILENVINEEEIKDE